LTKHSHDLRFRETALSHSNLLSSRYEKILLMQPLNHGEDYPDNLGDAAQKITLILLCQKLGQVHVGLGHRGSSFGSWVKRRNST
ncbi:hypothetical protein, partial [Paracoccus ravus]|uniref:hypothetical protein n=1 Tax=Paracoccus ravus TaxID=2447760 RepID=UPI001ADCAF96